MLSRMAILIISSLLLNVGIYANNIDCTKASAINLNNNLQPLPGWRFPCKNDIIDGWKINLSDFPHPFYIKADFTGDKKIDEVWILLNNSNNSWCVVMYVYVNNTDYKPIKIYDSDGKEPAQKHVLVFQKPGSIENPCVLMEDCKPNEPQEIKLKYNNICLGVYEAGCTTYYWDDSTNSFKNIVSP
jgi:hypothetical protein